MSIHDSMKRPLSIYRKEANIVKWIMKGKTTQLQNPHHKKGITLSNCRSVTCLFIIWKILIPQIRKELAWIPQTVSRISEGIPQGNKLTGWFTIKRAVHHQGGKRKAEKYSFVMDWRQKRRWYNLAKLNNWMSENEQNTRQSDEVNHKNNGKPESSISSKRNKFCRGENPKRHLLGRLTSVGYSHDATELYTNCTRGYKFTKLQETINHLIYIDEIKIFAKMNKNWRPWYKQ